jgi:hypothetical protein
MHDITSTDVRCNVNPSPATETVTVAPGEKIGFQLSNFMYHQGPVAIYLGKAPGSAAAWDGSGKNWFKVDFLVFRFAPSPSTSRLNVFIFCCRLRNGVLPPTTQSSSARIRRTSLLLPFPIMSHLARFVIHLLFCLTTVTDSHSVLQYLVRIENLALHLGTGVPEIFVSCAQVKITGSGSGNPSKVSIPGYIAANGAYLL